MEIIRGDTKYLRFQRHYCDNEIITELPEKLYFTIKFDSNIDDYLIQKTLNNGIEFNPRDNYYYITIEPEDTDNLPYGDYYYDIEVIKGEYKQTICRGEFSLTDEYTFARNEG